MLIKLLTNNWKNQGCTQRETPQEGCVWEEGGCPHIFLLKGIKINPAKVQETFWSKNEFVYEIEYFQT